MTMTMTMTTEEQELAIRVLACPMIGGLHRESGARTVGHFLCILAGEVWLRQECFNGKRPFGNSSWNWDVLEALIAAGIIEDDEDGQGDQAMVCAITLMKQMMLNIPSVIQLAHSNPDPGLISEALGTIKQHTTPGATA